LIWTGLGGSDRIWFRLIYFGVEIQIIYNGAIHSRGNAGRKIITEETQKYSCNKNYKLNSDIRVKCSSRNVRIRY